MKKYIKDSDDESSPQKPIKVKRLKTPPPIIKTKKSISKEPTQKYLVQGVNFKKLQKKAKKLGADSLQYSKRKNHKYMVEYNNKKIHFGSAKSEDFITHQDPIR